MLDRISNIKKKEIKSVKNKINKKLLINVINYSLQESIDKYNHLYNIINTKIFWHLQHFKLSYFKLLETLGKGLNLLSDSLLTNGLILSTDKLKRTLTIKETIFS